MKKRQANRIVLLLLTLLVLLASMYYSNRPDLPAPGPTFLMNTHQNKIDVSTGIQNAWSGFKVGKEFFVSNKNICKFILWHATGGEESITLNYLLKTKPLDVFINSKKAFKLRPRYQLRPVTQKIELLKGMNFIEFRLHGKSQLKIESVTIGNNSAPNAKVSNDLEANQGVVTKFHPAGTGSITLKAKGKLSIKQVEFIDGKKEVTEVEKSAGFMSDTVTHEFQFKAPGFLQFHTGDGELKVTGYQFKEQKTGNRLFAPETAKNAAAKEKPHIFIFLIDGCHAGHTGLAGYRRDTTPHMNAFAKDAVVFENAYCNATFTRSSVATIFTGFYPHRHKLRILTNRLPKGLFMLPEFLKKQGYKTALLTEAGNISKFFGFSQGVDNYQKIFRRWDDPRYLENNIFKFYTQWLESNREAKTPLFTYLHFRAPHFPIIPPPPYLDMYKKKKLGKDADRLIFHITVLGEGGHQYTPEEIQDITDDYDSSINYVDAEVGKMIAYLKEKGLYDSSYIIFTSDHGEALYEHRFLGHGHNVYDETSRVPLVVKFPKYMKVEGTRVRRVVQLADIFPTFAALYNETRYFDGHSLFESLTHKEEDDMFAFSTSFGMPPALALRWRGWHYIYHMYSNKEELFDLTSDPLKDVSQNKENTDLVTFFRSKFVDWLLQFDNLERTSQSVDLKKLPKEEYENLKSLGYIN